jgi:hypothetical protein
MPLPALPLAVPVQSPNAPIYATAGVSVLQNNQVIRSTNYVETNVSQSLDDGLDKVVASLTIAATNIDSVIRVQAQTALAISATGTATPVAKYFIINGVPTEVVGYFCPDTTATGGAPWAISGMAQSGLIPAGTSAVVQWVLGGATPGCEVSTGFTTVSAMSIPDPSLV